MEEKMTEQLETAVGSDYDGTGTDVSQIFHEDDPTTFVGPPKPTQPVTTGLVNYSGRFSKDHIYVSGRFEDNYDP
jgi:hypothetical protein